MTTDALPLSLYKANIELQLRITRLLQDSGQQWLEVVWKRNLVSDRRTVGRLFYAQLTKSRLTAS